jgi:hypothetical protein
MQSRLGGWGHLSHLSLLSRHGPQLIAFLARLVGTLAPSAVEGASKDVGERGRVEGVSDEIERLLVDCFGLGSDRLEVDGSDSASGMREGEVQGS